MKPKWALKIRAYLEESGKSLDWLAEVSQWPKETLQEYIYGTTKESTPGLKRAVDLAKGTGFTLESIFFDDNGPLVRTLQPKPPIDTDRDAYLAVAIRSIATTLNGVADALEPESKKTLKGAVLNSLRAKTQPRLKGGPKSDRSANNEATARLPT